MNMTWRIFIMKKIKKSIIYPPAASIFLFSCGVYNNTNATHNNLSGNSVLMDDISFA